MWNLSKTTMECKNELILLQKTGKKPEEFSQKKYGWAACQNAVTMAMWNNAEKQLTHQNFCEGSPLVQSWVELTEPPDEVKMAATILLVSVSWLICCVWFSVTSFPGLEILTKVTHQIPQRFSNVHKCIELIIWSSDWTVSGITERQCSWKDRGFVWCGVYCLHSGCDVVRRFFSCVNSYLPGLWNTHEKETQSKSKKIWWDICINFNNPQGLSL